MLLFTDYGLGDGLVGIASWLYKLLRCAQCCQRRLVVDADIDIVSIRYNMITSSL